MLRFRSLAAHALPLLAVLLLGACADSPTKPKQQVDRIAFLLVDDNGYKLHVINADGTEFRRIETDANSALTPTWSPDGQSIAFTGVDAPERNRDGIYTVREDGSGLTRIVAGPSVRTPAWAPDGRIAYVEETNPTLKTGIIVSVSANGSGRRVLVSAPDLYNDLAWSPDGRKLAYADLGSRVCILTLASKAVTCAGEGAGPEWTPDGKVSFIAPSFGAYDIFLMNADGTGITRLTTQIRVARAMSWAPDGERLVFERARGDRFGIDLYIMNRDGSELRQLTSLGFGAYMPAWSPGRR